MAYSEDCQGDSKRKNIALNYSVLPQFAMEMLPGQSFFNCCTRAIVKYEAEVEHCLYVFSIKPKVKGFEQTLVMGHSCANLLVIEANKTGQNINLPKVINMFRVGGGNAVSNNPSTSSIADNRASVNSQLLKAIILVVMLAWGGTNLKPKLTAIIKQLSDPNNLHKINDDQIRYFFTSILAKDRGGNPRTLSEIHSDVLIKIPKLGKMSFKNLEEYYQEITKQQKHA